MLMCRCAISPTKSRKMLGMLVPYYRHVLAELNSLESASRRIEEEH